MKKRIFIVIAALLLLLTGCGDKKKTYHEITLDELNSKIEAKDDFVLVLGASTCSACASYKVTMEKVINEYDLEVFYLDGGDLKTEEKAALLKIVYYTSTPTTVYFTDGIASDTHNRIVGAANYDAIVEDFKDNGYIGK